MFKNKAGRRKADEAVAELYTSKQGREGGRSDSIQDEETERDSRKIPRGNHKVRDAITVLFAIAVSIGVSSRS